MKANTCPNYLHGNTMRNHFELMPVDDLLTMPPKQFGLRGVLDAVMTYCPPYMHGIPKQRYINALVKAIERDSSTA